MGNDRCGNIWASLPGRWLWSVWQGADSLIAKFKEAGGTVREIDVRADTGAIISALVICIIACLPRAGIITVITPIPTKLRDKNARELVGVK